MTGLLPDERADSPLSPDMEETEGYIMRFNGVIFDLDGTLVNSLEDIADSMNGVLRKYGFPVHHLDRYKHFVGRGMRNLVYRALPEDVRDDEAHVARCRDSMLEEYRRNYVNKTRPYDGIMEMLGELARQGLKLAVFSNKNDDLTKKLVAALLPEGYFAAVIGSGPGMPEKPDPSGVLLISGQLGIHPERLIYVGDSDVDMETANKAGMCGVGALWGFRTKEELISSGARYVLDHPMDLFRILHEGNGA